MQKKKIIVIIVLMLIQSLFLLNNNISNAKALQDDSNIQVTLHCKLLSNSGEISNDLMTTGTYDFFDSPRLDLSSNDHDITQINFNEVQRLTINRTNTSNGNFSSIYGNYTFKSSAELLEYIVSAPKDTIIYIDINYTTNATALSPAEEIDPTDDISFCDMFLSNGYWWVIAEEVATGDIKVYKYNTDWTYTGYSKLLPDYSNCLIYHDGFWYVTCSDSSAPKIYKYSSDWVQITSYDMPYRPLGITYYGGYFWVSFMSLSVVYQYTTSFTLVNEYSILASPYDAVDDIMYDNNLGCFWLLIDNKLYKYSLNLTSMGYSRNLAYYYSGGFYDGAGYFYFAKYYADSFIHKLFYVLPFKDIYVMNFTYSKLGIDYRQNISLNLETVYIENCTLKYSFTSGDLYEYDHVNDLTIKSQNITINIDSWINEQQVNITLLVQYSSSEWKVPSEVDLKINGINIDDETYNSGSITLSTYPDNLIISSSSENIYFRLNITCIFTFTFSLDIISRTYLRRYFELLSDHNIIIERIDLPPELHIKKLYLNNIEYSNQSFLENNIFYITPTVTMQPSNIFKLEIILADEIYIPLTYVMNNLGEGTSQLFLTATANT
ncbi:MAG: hypothetical protein ACP6IY_18170, partial [Promethearchaeia archaeon]